MYKRLQTMGCLPNINWETLDFWTISPVLPTFHSKMLCSSRIVAMHRLSLFQKHQGKLRKNDRNNHMVFLAFLLCFQSVFLLGFIFQSCPHIFLGGWKKGEVFWGDFWIFFIRHWFHDQGVVSSCTLEGCHEEANQVHRRRAWKTPQRWSLHYGKTLNIGCLEDIGGMKNYPLVWGLYSD